MDWRKRAACRKTDPELFFPIGTTGPAVSQLDDAMQVCAACIVRSDCLQWALDNGIDHGVWGGLSEDERRNLKRRTARQRTRPLNPSAVVPALIPEAAKTRMRPQPC